MKELIFHCEPTLGDKSPTYKPADPVEALSLKSLINNHLCMGKDSPCASCPVLCGYGRRYLRETEKAENLRSEPSAVKGQGNTRPKAQKRPRAKSARKTTTQKGANT